MTDDPSLHDADPTPEPSPTPFAGLEILGDPDVGTCVDGICEVPAADAVPGSALPDE